MVGIAVIGAGYWGKNQIRIYKTLLMEKEIDDLRICDINEERAKQIGKDFDLEYTSRLDDIVNDKKITAVVIVTPSSTHYELSKLFLQNGKDVFVEKPITLISENANELVKIAEEHKKILMVGHLFRYHPAVRDIKKRINIGEFGELEMIITYRFALGVPRTDMGVILALAIHDLDLSCYLLNQNIPKSILVDNGKFHQDKVIEMTNISLDFENGAKSYIMASWNIPVYDKKRELIIIGSEKSAIVDYLTPSEYKIFDTKIKKCNIDGKIILEKEDKAVSKVILEYKEPLKSEILHYLNCLKTRKKPETDGLVGSHAVRMCEKALLSADTNKREYF